MARILIVDDSPTQIALLELTLADAGYETLTAPDGNTALKMLAVESPDLILTDLHMPGISGLELVEQVRKQFPSIPVVLMTADGTDMIAVEALRAGAASYIPKRILEEKLLSTVEEILRMLKQRRSRENVIAAMVESTMRFVIGNDQEMVAAVIQYLEEELRDRRYADDTGLLRIKLALSEAMTNAVDHGNLELDSKMRDEEQSRFYELGEQRRTEQPYADRQVFVNATIGAEHVTFVVRDEGPGFNPKAIPDPRNPENLARAHGRGMMLIHNFMDEVTHNDTGNEITMVKLREKPCVILAEDSATNQVLAGALLEKAGYDVLLAVNGQEAIDRLAESTEKPPVFILMDVEMPELDGLEATRRIRESESQTGRHTPILAMTAHSSAAELDDCRKAGMDGCLTKPVKMDLVAEALSMVRQSSASTGQPAWESR